jgi:RNA polymerase sporulation-specific sigma factor
MVFMLEALAALYDSALALILHVADRPSFPRPLNAAEEAQTIRDMLCGDELAAHKLIKHNLRLVAHIAKKYIRSGLEQEDLVSIGSIGLIKAVSSFRPEAGRLTAYASRCIENEILMALRNNKKNRLTLSLTDPIGSDREGNEIMLVDILGSDADDVPRKAEVRIESARALKLLATELDERERRVILLRYGLMDGITRPQHEVADALKISRSYVSRIEKRAIEKLRSALGASEERNAP